MKRLVPIVMFLLLPAALRAQWQIGLQAGYDYDVCTVNTGYQYDLNYLPQGGLTVSVPFQCNFSDWFGMRFDLAYVQKNTYAYRSKYYDDIYTKSANAYLSLPVLANFSFGGRYVRGYVLAGGYIGYWVSGHTKGQQAMLSLGATEEEYVSFDEKYSFSRKRDNRFDAGLAAGLGLSVQTRGRMGFSLEGRVCYGLTSTKNNYMRVEYPAYHTTFVLQAGVFWLLDKREDSRYCNCE